MASRHTAPGVFLWRIRTSLSLDDFASTIGPMTNLAATIKVLRFGAALAVSFVMLGCASTPYAPQPEHDPTTFSSYQSSTIGDLTVSVAILTDEEAKSHFGVDLGGHGVQSLWIRVRNASTRRYWFIRNIVDPDLYSADEAAEMVGADLPGEDFEAMSQFFRDESMALLLEPGMVTQGHIFVPKEEGGRYVEVRLASDVYESQSGLDGMVGGNDDNAGLRQIGFTELRFDFALTLPDGLFDFENLDPDRIYEGQALPDLNVEAFRSKLESLPCCVTNEGGTRNGDPLNIVLVGEYQDLMYALARAGWSFTHRITFDSVKRMVAAAMDGEGYAVAPISSLYVFGRKQDIALQRARRDIAQRNHMRLWLAPFTHGGRSVWVGQVSRDIGVKLSVHSPSLTTHVIDPAVDLTREYFLHSLFAEGFVSSFGFVLGSQEATSDEPARNLTNDPYFSDGLRLVVVLSTHPLPYTEVRSLLWEQSGAPMAEGQSEAAIRNVWPISSERNR